MAAPPKIESRFVRRASPAPAGRHELGPAFALALRTANPAADARPPLIAPSEFAG